MSQENGGFSSEVAWYLRYCFSHLDLQQHLCLALYSHRDGEKEAKAQIANITQGISRGQPTALCKAPGGNTGDPDYVQFHPMYLLDQGRRHLPATRPNRQRRDPTREQKPAPKK